LKADSSRSHAEACKRYREKNQEKHKETCKRYRQSYPDRVKASADRFHAANPGARKLYYLRHHKERLHAMRAYYAKNRETMRHRRMANASKRKEQMRQWREANPQWSKLYYQANKERLRKSFRVRYHANPEVYRSNTRRYNARKRAGKRKSLVPTTRQLVQQRFELFRNRCVYCGSEQNLEADHVLALKRGGIDEPENIVPACRSCNGSKHARPVEDWYRSQPFFSEARWRSIQRHCPHAASGQLLLSIPPPLRPSERGCIG
jgi:5-methylcytosine-specific restriction endonuclease McrA